jgi:hypothetical protein
VRRVLEVCFGAHAQVIVGALCSLAAAAYWGFGPRTIASVFHISMFFGIVACYGIIATGLAVLWLDARTPDADE